MATAITTTTVSPIVTLKGNQAFANSRNVAAFFGKRHDNVLRDIEYILLDAPEASLNFEDCSYQAVPGGRSYPAFNMTKDGFVLLAMGFTGKEAMRFKLAYIAAFNELEAKANASVMALPDFTNPAAAARAWADEVEQKQQLR